MLKDLQSLQDLDRDWRLIGLHGLGLGVRTGRKSILLGFNDLDIIGQRFLGSHLACRIPRQHNLDLN